MPTKTIDQAIEMINNTKKRDLNDWNIAEHYEPRNLVQVLSNVSYTHPYADSYYNRRDNSLMLVFSNPFDEHSLVNNEDFSVKLHSDVGFRNYLEKIYDMIIEWTRDEEAKYQASLVAKDVDHYRSESTERENATVISSPRSKSSKKISSEKEKTLLSTLEAVTEPNSAQPSYITDNFVGHNSLKAWKMDQVNKQAEAAEAERAKKVKSPVKQAGKDSKMAGGRPKSSSKSPTKPQSAAKSAKPSKAGSRLGSTKKTSRSNSRTKEVESEKEVDNLKIQKANNAVRFYTFYLLSF